MRRLLSGSIAAAVVAALGVGLAPPSSPAPPGAAAPRAAQHLDAWTATDVTSEQLATLARQGFDLHESHPTGDTSEVSLVMTADEAKKLRAQGIDVRLARVKGGQTVRQFAAAQAVNGYNVWRSYDEPGGHRDQLVAAARTYPGVTKLVKLGTTYQGRDILALKVTQGARGHQGRLPARGDLQRHPARARVDRPGDDAPAHEHLPPAVGRRRRADEEAPPDARSCGSCR